MKIDVKHVIVIVNLLNQTMTDPLSVESHPPCIINSIARMHATGDI